MEKNNNYSLAKKEKNLFYSMKNLLTKSLKQINYIISQYQHLVKFIIKDEKSIEIITQLKAPLKKLAFCFSLIKEILFENEDEKLLVETNETFENIEELHSIFHYAKLSTNKLCNQLVYDALKYIQKTIIFEQDIIIKQIIFSKKSYISNEIKDKESIYLYEIETILDFFPKILNVDENDIFNFPKSSQLWQDLMKDVKFLDFGLTNDQLTEPFKPFFTEISCTCAVLIKMQDQSFLNKYKQMLVYGIYYGLNQKTAFLQTSKFFCNPISDIVFYLFNIMGKNKFIKVFQSFSLPKINYHKILFIKKEFPSLTLNWLKQANDEGLLNNQKLLKNLNQIEDNSYVKIRLVSTHRFNLENFYDEAKNNSNFSCLLKNEKNFFSKIINCKKRNLSPVAIKNCPDSNTKLTPINAIVIHFHGGGFIALKTHFHQYFTRIWANDTNAPVFSIDYTLSPKAQYPVALDECWQSYQWILKYCNNYLRIDPKKIIFVGDSAGGSFALSITFLAAAHGLRQPDGIILGYPALSIDENKLSPAWMKYGLRNFLLPYSAIQIMLKAYLPKEVDPSKDLFISSLICDDELLKLLPPVDIICGDHDPLKDDSWRFYYKLKNLQKKVSLKFLKNIPHGFLNFAIPFGVSIAHHFVKEFSKSLISMINL